jgi:RHS repeat-associated protein
VPRVASSRALIILSALLLVFQPVLRPGPVWASSSMPQSTAKGASADIQPGPPMSQPPALATPGSSSANLTHPIAASANHSFALKSDGTVWTWGDTCVGQPGNGTNSGGTCNPGPTPAQTTSFGSVASLAAAFYHAVALRSDGTVWAWGDDEYGTIGAGGAGDVNCGDQPCALRPVQAQTSGTFTAVGAGEEDSYAVRSDGTVWAWGSTIGLGIGTFTGPDTCYELGFPEPCSKTPVQVGGLSGVTMATGGTHLGMALQSNGTVWTWGFGDAGQLGNGTTGRSAVAVQVSDLSNAIAIAATNPLNSEATAAALRADGTVWTWGYGGDGQLGNGTTDQINPTPVQVSNLSGVAAIAGGWGHFLALKADGTVWTWPSIGHGGKIILTPVQVNNLGGVVSIAAGRDHYLAAKADGTVWAWGNNTYGQLGDGTTTDRAAPIQSQMTDVPAPAPFVLPQQPLTGGAITGSETYGGHNPCYVCSLARLAQGYVGKPVNTGFGNMTDTASDIEIPGRGFSLTFLRTYNSLAAGTDGPFGYGWTTNVLLSLSQPGGTGPVTITQEGGSQVVFNQSGSIYTPAAPRLLATLTHNGDGTWTFVRLAKETFTFSSTGLLTSEQDLNGYTTVFSYTGSQLTGITDESGRTLAIGWSGSHISSVTDNSVSPARAVAFQYNDGAGNLTDVIDVKGGHSHFAYDASHRMTNMFDPVCYAAGPGCNGGNGVVNLFDASNRVTSQTDNLGRETTFAYNGDPGTSTGSTTTITDPKGNVRLETYQYGVRTAVTYGYGTAQAATWRYRYDPDTGALISVIDPNSNTTTYTVDSSGNWLSRTDQLGRLTQRTYNAFNEPLTEIDPLGVTTSYTYDNRGNPTGVSRPLLDGNGNLIATQATQYNHADPGHPGDLTSVVDADGKTWSYSYDSYGDRSSSTDPLGNTSSSTYNADGWLLTTVAPRGNVAGCNCASQYTTTYGYADTITGQTNAFGDVATVTDPLGHVTANHYDANRTLTSTTDADGNPTTYVYDLENERTQIIRADGTILRTDYNPDGTVLDQKDGENNAILSFGYDALARVTTTTDALGNVTTFSFDGSGNLLTQQVPGGNCSATPVTSCITRTYDADNELIGVTYSDGTTPNVSSISYDADGRRVGMTDGTGSSTWVWDSLHRLTSFTDGNADQVQYQYNLRNLVTQTTYPGNLSVSRGYDDAGRWTSVSDWLGNATSFGYDPDGNLTSRTLPASTGVVDSVTFNAAEQLTSTSDAKGQSAFFSATYGRDNVGRATSDSSLPSSVNSYRYTSLNQLCYAGSSGSNACSTPPSGAQAYGYDAADNLTSDRGTTQAFNAADELCWTISGSSPNGCASPPAGATRYSYDTRGNRTTVTPASGSVTNLGFNLADELKSWSRGTATASYAYNGDGLRMSKTVSGTTTRFTWDVSGPIPLLISDGAIQYLYGPGGQLVEQVAGTPAISLVGTASASGRNTSLTLTLPVGRQAGDEVYLASTQPATTTVTAPAGYAVVTTVTSGGASPLASTTVFRHTLAAGETSVTLSYSTRNTTQAAVLGVYRGIDVNLPVDVFSSASATASTSVTAPSVTTTYAGEQLLAFQGAVGSFASSATWTAPSGMTERRQVNPGNTATGLADQPLTAAGATGTRASLFGSSANLTTVLIGVPVRPVLYYHADQLGSIRALTDGGGVVRGTFTYDPYGNLTASTGTWSTPFGFAGEYQDAETGFIYLRARYYDPATAQFLTRDPALATTRAPYAYVAGNPLNARDPSGLWFGLDDLIATAGGALVGGALSAGTQFVSTGSVDWGQVGIDAASGAVFGETTLYAGPIAGGAAAGFVDSVGSQLYHNGGFNNFSAGDVALSTGEGAALGWAGGALGRISWLRGREFSFGGIRFSLGNWGACTREGNAYWAARFPHYHRQVTDAAGEIVSGGGWKWHRPWEQGW